MGSDKIEILRCGICLLNKENTAYYLCSIAPICKDCLYKILISPKIVCPLCPPIKKCEFRIDSYDIQTYTSPSQS
jgi:hypothetical protein